VNPARFLVCRPDHYAVRYEINPWMNRQVQPDHALAVRQWESLASILEDRLGGRLERLAPSAEQPDLVFTANAGYVHGQVFIPSRFRHPQRRGEEPLVREWFRQKGYTIRELPGSSFFEGFGDALPWNGTVFAGYRFRSDIRAHLELGRLLDLEVISLELTDARYYHLDTCFCPLETGDIIYYPGAFDPYALQAIRGIVPEDRLIPVGDSEAASFCCNAVNVGSSVVMNEGAGALADLLTRKGYSVYRTNLSEFVKSGGSAKCLTLRLE